MLVTSFARGSRSGPCSDRLTSPEKDHRSGRNGCMVTLDHSDPMRPVRSGGVPTIIGKIATAKDT